MCIPVHYMTFSLCLVWCLTYTLSFFCNYVFICLLILCSKFQTYIKVESLHWMPVFLLSRLYHWHFTMLALSFIYPSIYPLIHINFSALQSKLQASIILAPKCSSMHFIRVQYLFIAFSFAAQIYIHYSNLKCISTEFWQM